MDCQMTNFKTVIASRDATETPSELEVKLRQNADKVRVVQPMPHKADFLFPSSDTTVAVRIFNQATIEEMEEKCSSRARLILRNQMKDILLTNEETSASLDSIDDDFSGIRMFENSFKHSIVFFLLSDAVLVDQLGRMDSIVSTLQRSLAIPTECNQQKESGNARVYIVSNIDDIVHVISMTLASLGEEKRSRKEAFFLQQAVENYLPDQTGQLRPTSHVSRHVSNALRLWSSRMDLSIDDTNVVMHVLGSLEKIMEASEDELNGIPVDSAMKYAILEFFGSTKASEHHLTANTANKPRLHNDISQQQYVASDHPVDPDYTYYQNSKTSLPPCQDEIRDFRLLSRNFYSQEPRQNFLPQQQNFGQQYGSQQGHYSYGSSYEQLARNNTISDRSISGPTHLHSQTRNQHFPQTIEVSASTKNTNQGYMPLQPYQKNPLSTKNQVTRMNPPRSNCVRLPSSNAQNDRPMRRVNAQLSRTNWNGSINNFYHHNF